MARQKGSLSLGGSLEPKVGSPLDARDRVPTLADLTAATSFPYSWIGMETYVVSENKKYRLVGSDPTVSANWEEVGSGSQITIDPTPTESSTNAVQSGGTYTALAGKVDKVNGKGLSTEDFTTAEKTKLDGIDLSNYVPTSQKGAASGVAELDANGKIPVSQMPNGFDNVDYGTAGGVVEGASGYTATSFTRTGESSPVTPTTDTIYIDTTLYISFMWGGSNYVSVGGGGVALGETSSTAYRGDRGKIAYDDSQTNKTNIGTMSSLDTTDKSSLVAAINEVKSGAGTDDYDELSNKPQIGGTTLSGNKSLGDLGIQPSTLATAKTIEGASVTTVQELADATQTHTDRSVVNNDGAHGFKVDTTGSRAKILFKNGNSWVEIPLGDIFRTNVMPSAVAGNEGVFVQFTGTSTSDYKYGFFYECVSDGEPTPTYSWVNREVQDGFRKDVLPTASVDYLGEVYMYTGATTQDLKKGFVYECILDGATYKWSEIRVQAAGGQTIQYDVMPTASGENVGQIIQYTGATTSVAPIYTNGYFYKCVAHEEESGGETITTYAWEQKLVQDSGDIRVKPEVTAFGVHLYNGIRSYVDVDLSKGGFSFSDVDLTSLKLIADSYYAGEISLAEIQSMWSVGDTKNIALSAMEATGVAETHDAQTVQMRILDMNHETLNTAISGKTKSLLTLGFLLAENGVYSSTAGWNDSARRTWCNDVVFESLPSQLQDIVKSVTRNNGQGTTDPGNMSSSSSGDRYGSQIASVDKVYIPNVVEITGSNYTPTHGAVDVTDATRYNYFANAQTINLTKDVMTCTNVKWYNGSNYNYYRNGLKCATSAGADVLSNVSTSLGIYLVINI